MAAAIRLHRRFCRRRGLIVQPVDFRK